MKPNPSVKEIITDIRKYGDSFYNHYALIGIPSYDALLVMQDNEMKDTILAFVDHYLEVLSEIAKDSDDELLQKLDFRVYKYYAPGIIEQAVTGLLSLNLKYTEVEWIDLFRRYQIFLERFPEREGFCYKYLPISLSMKQSKHFLKKGGASSFLLEFVKDFLEIQALRDESRNSSYSKELVKINKGLNKILGNHDTVTPFALRTNDIGTQVNEIVAKIKSHKNDFSNIFFLASEVTGSKPKIKFVDQVNAALETIGLDGYRRVVHQLLKVPLDFEGSQSKSRYEVASFLNATSQNFIKGLVWTCHRFSDKETISLLTHLAERCYKKIPGKGPAAASVGNACVYIVGNMKGKDGLGALSRLKLKVRQNNVKKTIDKILDQGAKKYGVSVEELKEMSVPDYHLVKGVKRIPFDDYHLEISTEGTKVMQDWVKPDGSYMKSVPSIVKVSPALKKKLQATRKEIKEIQKVCSAQKQRIDNQFILNRSWNYASFEKYYITHGLVFPIASKLIWVFENKQMAIEGIYIDDTWLDINGSVISWAKDENTRVKLWHPVQANDTSITAWREKMMTLQWKQPVKQAYREIYILTEAERTTTTYSNRMAAHILKQHQFSMLANLRNWKYALMGWFDDGRDNEICYKLLPEYQIRAEYWIDQLTYDEEAFNDAGIWLYVGTDQVKFESYEGATIDLEDVPKMVFTEIMRDVDLFVGVASVGNDPQWMDNNGERQELRNYWNDYSFGDLNEIAKTRKEVLANLLPRLKKIRDVATIKGNFLVVTGKLRTYKIHMGSGNILMEPHDQYLCIVPARGSDPIQDLFIPFEGDRGLSIVLSKAFLLAEDDKIQDVTITRQIGER